MRSTEIGRNDMGYYTHNPSDPTFTNTPVGNSPIYYGDYAGGKLVGPDEVKKTKKHECDLPNKTTILPVLGTTWDCPRCGKVWIVTLKENNFAYGYSARAAIWAKAGWWKARTHRYKISEGLGVKA